MNELYHHGIRGQKWGVRNGPPYPLGASDHSASERKAGWRVSLNTKKPTYESSKKSGIRLTDKQKKYLKIGAVVAVTALAVGGGVYLYKQGVFDSLVNKGRKASNLKADYSIEEIAREFLEEQKREADKKALDLANGIKERVSVGRKEYIIHACSTTANDNLNIVNNRCSMSAKDWHDFESLSTDIIKTENLETQHVKDWGKLLFKIEKETFKGNLTNCHGCTFNGVLRLNGYDVEAPNANGKMKRAYSALDYFKNCEIDTPYSDYPITSGKGLTANVVAFRSNKKSFDSVDILRTLEKKMVAKGEGTYGDLCGGGHSVMYKIENGRVKIYDNQVKNKWDSLQAYDKSQHITNGFIHFSRLDNLEPNLEKMLKDKIIVPRG